MNRVIYADVLVVINIYITFFLLRGTAVLAREKTNRIKLLISSFLGGIYSLTVLVPDDFRLIMSLIRVPVAVLFVYAGFGFTCLRRFLRLNISFFFCSFIFAGLMLALWYFVSPSGMYFNGSVVYFDVSILSLVIFTVICYVLINVFERLFKSRAPINTVFSCTVYFQNKEYNLKAFLDTGNRLKDYFTDKPVIIANKDSFPGVFNGKNITENSFSDESIRFVFCDTVAGKDFLPAFSPEKIVVRGSDYSFTTDRVTVAITEKKLLQGEYDALLPCSLFENDYSRKDERESEKIITDD